MLVDVRVELSTGEVVVVGSGAWFEDLKQVAANHRGSNAEYIIKIAPICFGDFPLRNPEPGLYYASNFGNLLQDCGFEIERYPETEAMQRWSADFNTWMVRRDDLTPEERGAMENELRVEYPEGSPNSYGVADNVDQVKTYLRYFIEHPTREFVIELVEVKRNPLNAGRGGGWRWHKWGPYIGTFDHKCEYLDDEDGIDGVLLFHIHEIKGPNEEAVVYE